MSSNQRWDCTACTFSNVSAAVACQICGQKRALTLPSASPQQQTQSQTSVTTQPSSLSPKKNQNDGTVVRSEHSGLSYTAPQSGWSCAVCSLFNQHSNTRCSACDVVRPPTVGSPPISLNSPPSPARVLKSTLSNAAAAAATTATPVAATVKSTSPTPTPPIHTPAAPAVTLRPGQFQCLNCTFINAAGMKTCELCNTPKPPKSTPAAASVLPHGSVTNSTIVPGLHMPVAGTTDPSASWSCLVCSLLNTADAARCSRCQTMNPLASLESMRATVTGTGINVSNPPRPRTARGTVQPLTRNSSNATATTFPSTNPNNNPNILRSQPNPQMPFAFAPTISAASALLDPSGELEAAEQWDRIMELCSVASTRFVDDSFSPGDRSIYGSAGSMSPQFAGRTISIIDERGQIVGNKNWGPFKWKRGRECMKASPKSWCILPFHADGSIAIQPSDIKQGELGNCWFISALSVLAERPHLIEHLLLTQEMNDKGAYQVRFCKSGQWRTVTIDDYFPVDPKTNRLAFSHTPNNELWVPLIEKAYAKVHGSYAAIESGSVSDAFVDLTGAPAERIELHANQVGGLLDDEDAAVGGGKKINSASFDPNILWATLLSYRQSGFLMGASCGRLGVNPDRYRDIGLRPDHAYAILDARAEENMQFIKLRNPWGTDNWKGDWSASSSKWTPAWRKILNYYPSESSSSSSSSFGLSMPSLFRSNSGSGGSSNAINSHGVFWITFTDFLAYFRTVDVCKFQDDWNVIRLRDEFNLKVDHVGQNSNNAAPRLALQPAPNNSGQMQLQFQNHAGAASSSSPAMTVLDHLPSGSWCSSYMYELTIPQSTWCFISLIQRDLRGSDEPKPHRYKNMGLFVLKTALPVDVETDLDKYQRCTDFFPDNQRMITCETLLTEVRGRYLVIPCSYAATVAASYGSSSSSSSSSPSSSDSTFPFIICLYSAHQITVKRKPAFLPALTIAKQLSVMRGTSKMLTEYSSLYTFDAQGGLWFVVVNRHPNKYLSITVDCTRDSRNLVPSRPGGLQTRDFIPPGHRQLLLVLITRVAESGYSYSRQCSFMHVDGVSGQMNHPPLRHGFDIHQPWPLDLNSASSPLRRR